MIPVRDFLGGFHDYLPQVTDFSRHNQAFGFLKIFYQTFFYQDLINPLFPAITLILTCQSHADRIPARPTIPLGNMLLFQYVYRLD